MFQRIFNMGFEMTKQKTISSESIIQAKNALTRDLVNIREEQRKIDQQIFFGKAKSEAYRKGADLRDAGERCATAIRELSELMK